MAPEVAVAVLRDLSTPPPLGLEPARKGAGLGAVGPDQLQAQKFARTGLIDETPGAEPIMQAGGRDMSEKDETGSIDQKARLQPAVRFAASYRGLGRQHPWSAPSGCR